MNNRLSEQMMECFLNEVFYREQMIDLHYDILDKKFD